MPTARKKTKPAPARKKDSRPAARSAKPAARKPAAKIAAKATAKAGKPAAAPPRAVPAPPAKVAPGSASRNIPLPGKGAAMAPGKGGAPVPGKGALVPGKGGPLPAKGALPGKPGAMGGPGDQARPGGRPSPRIGGPKKGGRKSPLSQRRGPNGEPFVPGDLLLPTGPQGPDEIQYLLRGSVAAEHAAGGAGVSEIIIKKGAEAEGDRPDLTRYAEGMSERFEKGSIEPLLPSRAPARRNFAGVVERAKHRRREIGAFLRGLDLGRTETSHMDSHGEASLQSLMEWAARLENLAEADEPERADFAQLHRGLDQLESKTEELIVDVELTLRRLRDRLKSTH
jgi:hypothetical protein